MQKEIKADNINDRTINNIEGKSLSDLENEILSNKNLKSYVKADDLELSKSNAINNNNQKQRKKSIEENCKKENINSLLSIKRNRNEFTVQEEKDVNEPNKKMNTSNSTNNSQNNIDQTNTKLIVYVNIDKQTEPHEISTALGIECPYLGSIKRHLLDFDFEKVCSISLSNLNVYACLVCGKYYQGRGKNTHAYVHSLQEDHHLFINLNNEKIICLPEGYEVIDNSLKDINLNLKPVYSQNLIAEIDYEKDLDQIYSSALDGTEYIPGCIGLNNIKKTDYVNVIIQALCRVATLRDYFLKYDDNTTNLVL